MNETKTGGPAFPQPDMIDDGQLVAQGHTGMTLRDYFAAKAMQGYLADPEWRKDISQTGTAYAAYRMADDMLEARNQ